MIVVFFRDLNIHRRRSYATSKPMMISDNIIQVTNVIARVDNILIRNGNKINYGDNIVDQRNSHYAKCLYV